MLAKVLKLSINNDIMSFTITCNLVVGFGQHIYSEASLTRSFPSIIDALMHKKESVCLMHTESVMKAKHL